MDTKQTSRILYPVLGVLLAVLVLLYIPRFFVRKDFQVQQLPAWSYTDSSGNTVNIQLPDKLYQTENGWVEIRTTLPQSVKASQFVCFWTYYQSVDAYLDGKLIYQYNNSDIDSFGEASTSHWNFVELQGEPAGKQLTLRMHTPYRDVNLRLRAVVCGSLEEVHHWLEHEYGIYAGLETAFVCVGIMMLAMACVQKADRRHKQYQSYAGAVLIMFSIYLRTGTKALPVYWMSPFVQECLCFICLLMMALPLILYLRTKVQRKPLFVKLCNVLAICQCTTVTALFLLHGVGLVDLHRSVGIGLIFLFAAVVCGLVFAVYYLIAERKKSVLLSLFSLLVIAVVMGCEYVQFYQLNTLPFDTGVLSHIGALVVVTLEVAQYVYYLGVESKKNSMVKQENRNLQVQVLTSQIRPHFILNTLGAIRTLIKEDPNRASDLLYEFSKYIRSNLENKDYSKPVPFPEELNYIETYLALEQARFGDMLRIEYDIETREFWVLPLSVQPFVENAVKHGLFNKRDGGTVRIITRRMPGGTLVEIRDDGVGFDTNEVKKMVENRSGVGMSSAIVRIEEEMGGKVSLFSSMKPGASGTCVRIELPEKRKERK